MEDEKNLRKVIRTILKEELASDEREKLKEEICKAVSQAIDQVLLRRNVHKKGLSDQQASTLFRCVLNIVDEKLDEFTSKKRPEKYKNYQDIIEKYDL